MSDITIRRLAACDADIYRDVRLEGLLTDPQSFGATHGAESACPPSWFAERLETSYVLGAFEEDKLLGVVGFAICKGIKSAHKGMIWGMYVRPIARGNGVGDKLLAAVIKHAASCVELVQLAVVVGNAAAVNLYARHGFTEYGFEKHGMKWEGRYYDEVLMVKYLAAIK